MKRLARTLEVLAWAAFFVCATALLLLRYALLPHIESLRPQIVARVSAIVGQPVRIGGIEAQWLGLRPQINLTDVRVYDAEGREALVLPSVENILSWRSAARGRLELHKLRIDGPRLIVRRDAQGALYVGGFKVRATPGEAGFSDWLFAQRDIEVRNAEIDWRDEARGAPPLVLSALNLRIDNQGAQHALGFAARLPAEVGTKLELRAELHAVDIDDVPAWNGRLYAELGYADLAALARWVDYPVELEHAQAAARLWLTVAAGQSSEATADVALADVHARLRGDLPPFELDSALGRFVARRAGEHYELGTRKLTLAPAGRAPLAPLEFDVAWQPGGGLITARALELAPLVHLGEALPLPEELRRATSELAPRGQLTALRYEWQGALATPAHYGARAEFVDLGVKPRETLPGFARLAGTVEASDASGRLVLQSRGAELELPRLFPEPHLTFDVLAGEFAWRRDGATITVQVPSLTFTNADLSGNAFGSYAYDGSGPGALDLSAVLSRADARSLPHYLPLGALMGEKPRQWLVRSILAGEASDVQLRLRGDLRAFPFVNPAQGDISVSARVRKGILDYAADWPRIDDIEAQLSFQRNRMAIAGKSGTILGVALADVDVSIAELGSRAPRVLVTGQARGASSRFLQFLQASPLRSSAGRFTEPMSASGDGALRLRLELPLADLRTTKVVGEYQIGGNQVTLTRELPPLEQVRGTVVFTQSTLALRGITGRAFGGPVNIAGGSRPSGAMEFVARGEAQAGALGPLVPERLRSYLSGASPYVATVTIRDGLQRVAVESSLRGIASALPPPFAKSGADALPLRVEYTPAEGGARDRVALALARVAAADVRRARHGDAMELQRAALSLSPGGQQVRLPDRPGILVYGSAATADLDRWRRVLTSGGSADVGATLPVAVELKLAHADVLGKRVQNLAVRATGDAAGWSAVVDADELAGELTYSNAGPGRLTAHLLQLTIPADAQHGAQPATTKPSEMPALEVTAETFSLRGKNLGRLELAAVPDGADWRIDKLALASADASFDAKGRWRDGKASDLDFSLDASDAGKFLARIGYPNSVRGGKSQLSGSLTWAGDPSAIDYASLTGEVKLNAEDGQFLEIDPGFGKLISLMNLQALPRRITLDFRDVFSKGFRFDRIEATSVVDQGVMDLRQFRMRGPAADVAMSGAVDLAHETQNLHVRVVPSLGGSASTLVTIVNPVAGVASALAQHVLKNPLGQLFAHEFDVSGSWTDPKVAKANAEATPTETATP